MTLRTGGRRGLDQWDVGQAAVADGDHAVGDQGKRRRAGPGRGGGGGAGVDLDLARPEQRVEVEGAWQLGSSTATPARSYARQPITRREMEYISPRTGVCMAVICIP
jgi:hypothetical protein